MIPIDQKFSPNWWDYSFCIEIDFMQPTSYPRSGFLCEVPFTPEKFAHIMRLFADDLRLDTVAALVELIRRSGNLRLRPGALWNIPAQIYNGDVYDCPMIWDPFTRFPFGPMVQGA